jgi:hypothetical protein
MVGLKIKTGVEESWATPGLNDARTIHSIGTSVQSSTRKRMA